MNCYTTNYQLPSCWWIATSNILSQNAYNLFFTFLKLYNDMMYNYIWAIFFSCLSHEPKKVWRWVSPYISKDWKHRGLLLCPAWEPPLSSGQTAVMFTIQTMHLHGATELCVELLVAHKQSLHWTLNNCSLYAGHAIQQSSQDLLMLPIYFILETPGGGGLFGWSPRNKQKMWLQPAVRLAWSFHCPETRNCYI